MSEVSKGLSSDSIMVQLNLLSFTNQEAECGIITAELNLKSVIMCVVAITLRIQDNCLKQTCPVTPQMGRMMHTVLCLEKPEN